MKLIRRSESKHAEMIVSIFELNFRRGGEWYAWMDGWGGHLETAARGEEAEVDEVGGGEAHGEAEDEAEDAAHNPHDGHRECSSTRMEITAVRSPSGEVSTRRASALPPARFPSETSNGDKSREAITKASSGY
jgi:hypothetical protein